jgi:hypothetical protein
VPYEVVRVTSTGKHPVWVVRKKGGGRVFGRHPTRDKALAQLRALYASEHK